MFIYILVTMQGEKRKYHVVNIQNQGRKKQVQPAKSFNKNIVIQTLTKVEQNYEDLFSFTSSGIVQKPQTKKEGEGELYCYEDTGL